MPISVNLFFIKAFHSWLVNDYVRFFRSREEGLLLSWMSRLTVEDNYTAPKPSLAKIEESYGFGVSNSHPLNDENKRGALITRRLFLELNE